MDISVITACFYPDEKPLSVMRKSAERVGVNVVPYGVGKPYGGFMDSKCVQLLDVLSSMKSEYVLYVDACDVVFQLGIEAIRDRYRKITPESKIVLAGDNALHPYERKSRWFTKRAPLGNMYQYPCVGVFMGKRVDVIRALSQMLKLRDEIGKDVKKKFYENDQGWWILAMTYGRVEALIDYECQISLSMHHYKPDWFLSTKPLVVVKNGICPAIIHFNGQKPKGKLYNDLVGSMGLL